VKKYETVENKKQNFYFNLSEATHVYNKTKKSKSALRNKSPKLNIENRKYFISKSIKNDDNLPVINFPQNTLPISARNIKKKTNSWTISVLKNPQKYAVHYRQKSNISPLVVIK